MFDVYCPTVRSHVLRWPSDVVSLANRGRGEIDVLIRCDCDELVLVRTGRARRGAEQVVHGITPDADATPDLSVAR